MGLAKHLKLQRQIMAENNTIAGWVLFAGIAALGLTIVSGEYFAPERPEKMGYPIAGVAAEGASTVAATPIAVLLAKADATKGAQVFQKCTACHNAAAGGAAGIGPNLYHVLGRPVASMGGFAYSDALKAIKGGWDFDKINTWLTAPGAMAPGTKMTFAGIENEQDRANVILYLNQQGSNLPLPKPEAAPAAKAADAKPAGAAKS
jgi:cytochrome c